MFSFLDHLNLIEDDSSRYEVTIGDNGFSYLDLMSEKKARISFEEKQKRETGAALDGSTRAKGQSNLKHVETVDHDEICLDTDLISILRDMEQRRKRMSVFPWVALVAFALTALWVWMITNAALPVLAFALSAPFVVTALVFVLINAWFYDRSRKDIHFQYNIVGKGRVAFDSLNAGLDDLSASQQVLLNTGERHFEDTRYTGGSESFLDFQTVDLSHAAPPLLDLDFEVWHLRAFGKDLYFMPDHILVFDGSQIGGIKYDNLDVGADLQVIQARDNVRVTADSKIVGSTWRFVNNDGSPDKRFNNNVEIPLIEFGAVKLIGSGLNLNVFVSNQHGASAFPDQISAIKNLASMPAVRTAEERHKEASKRRQERLDKTYSIVLESLCCMMFADGKMSKTELEKTHKLMQHIRSPWNQDQIESRIKSFSQKAKNIGLAAMLDDVCDRAKTIEDTKQKQALLKCLDHVMKADGKIEKSEQKIRDRIADAMN